MYPVSVTALYAYIPCSRPPARRLAVARYVRPLCEGRVCAAWARSRVAALGLGQRRLQDASRPAEYQAGKKERKQRNMLARIWKHSTLVKSL